MNPDDITANLAALSRGDPAALEHLLPVVYAELKRLAAGYLKQERPGHTLQPTALAHEAFLRFGVFSVGVREARVGRNPQTKEPMEIPASRSVRFKAGQGLREAVKA